MTMQLTDDGTMDTVIRCSDCGEEFRFNYDPEMGREYETDDADDNYDSFVAQCIEDATSDHDCVRSRKSTDKTPVTGDNYFGAAKGLYWYCSDWHGGQDSELYSIMSARLDYHPAMSERGPDAEDESGDFYAELQGGG